MGNGAETVVTASDRRLKRSIVPLYHSLLGRRAEAVRLDPELTNSNGLRQGRSAQKEENGAGVRASKQRRSAAAWLLRELRPVSFRFRADGQGEAKGETTEIRFGFVAQELERVLPDLVRQKSEPGADNQRYVAYQDFIAMLTLSAQAQQDRLNAYEAWVRRQRGRARANAVELGLLHKRVAIFDRELRLWEGRLRRLLTHQRRRRRKSTATIPAALWHLPDGMADAPDVIGPSCGLGVDCHPGAP